MMERIISDFKRRRRGFLVRCVISAVAVWCVGWIPLAFSGGWVDWLRVVWIIVAAAASVGAGGLLVRAFVDILGVAVSWLRKQLNELPPDELRKVIDEYPDAKALGERWFMTEHILFYTSRRALIFRYDDIKSVILKKDGDLLLTTSHGDETMPVLKGENAGIIFAVLKSRNPDIKKGS